VAWLLPGVVVLAAVAAFGAWLLRGRLAADGPAPGSSTAGNDAQRIREEREALDG
jgi:hypothetical protein